MSPRSADSAQVLALIGSLGGFILTHYDRIIAALCGLVGIAYTLWKWRREIRRATRE